MDVPNAFIQTLMPPKEDVERVILKIWGKLVDWLVEIDPTAYLSLVVVKRGIKVIYLDILRVIYGMLEACILWYNNFGGDLERISFEFNNYYPYVANRMGNKQQHTFGFMLMMSCRVMSIWK